MIDLSYTVMVSGQWWYPLMTCCVQGWEAVHRWGSVKAPSCLVTWLSVSAACHWVAS